MRGRPKGPKEEKAITQRERGYMSGRKRTKTGKGKNEHDLTPQRRRDESARALDVKMVVSKHASGGGKKNGGGNERQYQKKARRKKNGGHSAPS